MERSAFFVTQANHLGKSFFRLCPSKASTNYPKTDPAKKEGPGRWTAPATATRSNLSKDTLAKLGQQQVSSMKVQSNEMIELKNHWTYPLKNTVKKCPFNCLQPNKKQALEKTLYISETSLTHGEKKTEPPLT